MQTPFKGQCACGAVRYESTAAPTFAWLCHCRDCQRASGSAYCAIMYIPREALTVSGEATYFTVTAESGNAVSRGFCGACGAPMFIQAELAPALQGVWAASLDQADTFNPSVQVWCDSARSWDTLHPDLPRIAKAPSEAEFAAILTAASA